MAGLPLLIELLLIGGLSMLLIESDREMQREADYRRFSALNARIMATSTEAPYLVFNAMQTGSPKVMEGFNQRVALLKQYGAEVQSLCNKRPELVQKDTAKLSRKVNRTIAVFSDIGEILKTQGVLGFMQSLQGFRSEIDANRDLVSFGLSQLIEQGERLTRETQQRQAHIRNLQKAIIISGVLFNVVIAVALSIFFRKDILGRIRKITSDTLALSKGQEMSPPLAGRDEIAVLDQAFHSMHRQLVQASEREKDLFNNASDVICIIDAQERFTKSNQSCFQYWGYEPDELIGKSVWEIVSADNKTKTEDWLMQSKITSRPVSFENQLNTKSGDKVDALWSIFWSVREQCHYCIVHDMTEQKKVAQAKKQFLAMVSDDLKSPLSLISGAISSLVARKTDALPEKAIVKLDIARKNVHRLLALVNDLLQITEMDSANLEVKKESVEVDEILRRSIQDVEALADKSGLQLQLISIKGVWFVDPNRIMQVLVNLLSNAIKFSPENSVVTLKAEEQGDYIVCNVVDTGRGVPESHKQAIFEKFKQVEASDGKRKAGTGLGLPICKQIIEEHGGMIGVTSKEGQGSTFWFRVPRDESVSMRLRAQTLTEAKELQERRRKEQAAAAQLAEMEKAEAIRKQKKPAFAFGNLKLSTKGILLVGVPIVFELVFVGALTLLLNQVDSERKAELRQRMIAVDATKLMVCHLQASLLLTRPTDINNWYQMVEMSREIERITALLHRRLEKEPTTREHMERVEKQQMQVIEFWRNARAIMARNGNNPSKMLAALAGRDRLIPVLIGLSHRILKVVDDAEEKEFYSPTKQKNLRQKQGQLLVAGLLANVLTSLALAIFFTRDINSRLVILADNADRLAHDKELNPLVPGSDEISNLDQVFHQTAAALGEARQKERAVFDNSQDVICAVDQEGVFGSVNPACEKIFGYAREELRSMRLSDLIVAEEKDSACSELLGDHGNERRFNVECNIVKKDGTQATILWSASRAEDKNITFCVARDISDRKQLEQLKQDFLAMVSHDLRTPLTSIIGVAKLIESTAFGAVPETSLPVLSGINKNGDKLLELINDLLDIEKLEAGKMELVIESVLAGELVQTAINGCKMPSRVRTSVNPDCADMTVECDADRMIQAICSLLNFAFARLPKESVIDLKVVSNPEHFNIELTCGSLGLSKKMQSQLFERFKTRSSPDDAEEGTGLALPIASKVIQAHGGEIESRNNDGNRETTFSFIIKLPIKRVALKA